MNFVDKYFWFILSALAAVILAVALFAVSRLSSVAEESGYRRAMNEVKQAQVDQMKLTLDLQNKLSEKQAELRKKQEEYRNEITAITADNQQSIGRLRSELERANREATSSNVSAEQVRKSNELLSACVTSVGQLDRLLAEYQVDMREATDYIRLQGEVK